MWELLLSYTSPQSMERRGQTGPGYGVHWARADLHWMLRCDGWYVSWRVAACSLLAISHIVLLSLLQVRRWPSLGPGLDDLLQAEVNTVRWSQMRAGCLAGRKITNPILIWPGSVARLPANWSWQSSPGQTLSYTNCCLSPQNGLGSDKCGKA